MIFFTAIGMLVVFSILVIIFTALSYAFGWALYCLREWFRYMSHVQGPSTMKQKWNVYRLLWKGYKVVEAPPTVITSKFNSQHD